MNEVVIKVIGNYSYQTSRCLGQGVYGKVYQGQQRQSKEKVAIKKIDLATFTNDKYLENAIFSQIYLLKRFNHPNIVKFKDVLSSKNSLYIITQFCQSGDLKEMIKKKRLNEEEAFEIMRQILSGFTQLVKEKIIHRDLKPANILINQKTFKIGDFGFAKYVDNFGSQMLKSCVGSPIYMAPQILQRTQYTTKCDIWSIGVIFYEMIHGYPPWKARDEAQLLKGIKNIPITQVLKKSNLLTRGNQFLKRTLAYSEQERIGWSELFDNYGPKNDRGQKLLETSQKLGTASKERSRVISANSATNLSPWNQSNKPNTPLTPFSSGSNLPKQRATTTNINSYTATGTGTSAQNNHSKRRNLFSGTNGNNNSRQTPVNSNNSDNKKLSQLEGILVSRKTLAHLHFYCLQLHLLYPLITNATNKPQNLGKLLLSLSLLVKNRNTFCMSIISSHTKSSKIAQETMKKMQQQHETYELLYNDLILKFEKLGIYKTLRSQMISSVGHSQIINEDRMQKLEQFVFSVAKQNSQITCEEVKKKCKNLREIRDKEGGLVEGLGYIVDIMLLCSSKDKVKSFREITQQQKHDQQQLKDYIARLINKADKF